MDTLAFLQWPTMVVTLVAAWAVGSRSSGRRRMGFWLFIASNVLWIAWGVGEHVWALIIILQLGLFALNLRGAHKNDQPAGSADQSAVVE